MNDIADVLTAIVVVAGIFVLASGSNKGPALIQNLGSAFSNALGTAVGTSSGQSPYAA